MKIPEDLKERWTLLDEWVRGPVTESTEMPGEIGRLSELLLIERIGNLYEALILAKTEIVTSGNWYARDYNWPEVSRKIDEALTQPKLWHKETV